MAKKISGAKTSGAPVAAVYDRRSPSDASPRRSQTAATKPAKPSALLDTRVIYCGDNLEQLGPCRTGHHWGEAKEKRALEDRHENTKAYIDYLRPRCVQLARVLKQTGSFYYYCDWHASHYVN
jgi:hypothetical protein